MENRDHEKLEGRRRSLASGSDGQESSSEIHDVAQFHEKFGVPVLTPESRYTNEEILEVCTMKINHLYEELKELEVAFLEKNAYELADALIDLVYVAKGFAIVCGLPWSLLWEEVHNKNMTKLRASSKKQSKRKSIYDVVKPPNWSPPDIKLSLIHI